MRTVYKNSILPNVILLSVTMLNVEAPSVLFKILKNIPPTTAELHNYIFKLNSAKCHSPLLKVKVPCYVFKILKNILYSFVIQEDCIS